VSSAAEAIALPQTQQHSKLIPSNGGWLKPFQPGQTGNPSGRSKRFYEVQVAAREASPQALQKLVELMASDDERVAIIAANSVLDRAFGKPKEQKTDDNQQVRPNLSALAPDMLAQLRSIMSVLAGQADAAPSAEAKAQDVVSETDQTKP
jgi:hypothetical protein